MIFGAEDSLVSTVGVLFGIASTTYDKSLIIVTGLIVVAVEALSMGAGAFLSETSAEEYENGEGLKNTTKKQSNTHISDGIIMFLSYFFAGFIPLSPYLFLDDGSAKYVSILLSVIALYFLGYIPQKKVMSGVRMMIVAGFAILIGFLIADIADSITLK